MHTFLLAAALLAPAPLAAPLAASLADPLATAPLQPAPLQQAQLDHQKIAAEFAQRLGYDPARPGDVDLGGLFAQHYVHADLGAFHVEWPVAQLPGRSSEFKDCCLALVECQKTWLDWVQTKGVDQKAVRADLAAVAKWVAGWNAQVLARGKGGQSVAQIVAPQPAAAEALARFNDALRRLTPIGAGREQPSAVKLVFAPTRQDFAEFCYFAGWILEDLRPVLWLDSVPDWTQAFVRDFQVVALQYTITGRPPRDYTSGTWMNERDPDVMQQQVVQLATNGLFLDHYGERVPGAFVGGLSMNLVVDAYGQVNTRVDGDTRSKQTSARDIFIPGAPSEGGFLAKNSAETRWRENHGSDHFLPMLQSAQEEGGSEARNEKNKPACFSIRDDAGGGKHVVKAPFLGGSAVAVALPPESFRADYYEFLRAYKSGFIHWLQTAAVGPEKASRERFAQLLRKLADPNLSAGFEAVFQEVYEGLPLSNADADKDCLEGRFLRWLPRAK